MESCFMYTSVKRRLVEFSTTIMPFSLLLLIHFGLIPSLVLQWRYTFMNIFLVSWTVTSQKQSKLIFDKFIRLNLIRKGFVILNSPITTYATVKSLPEDCYGQQLCQKLIMVIPFFVITLINHIYQLMTILQGNEIMFVWVINHIGLSFLWKIFTNASNHKRIVIQLQTQLRRWNSAKRNERKAACFFFLSLAFSCHILKVPLFLCVKAINFTLIVIFPSFAFHFHYRFSLWMNQKIRFPFQT